MHPRRSNPFVPCGNEDNEWVMSSYGHMAVLDIEGPLTTSRKILITTTVLLGIIQFVLLFVSYNYHFSMRGNVTGTLVRHRDRSDWDSKVLFWFILSGLGRFYHFIDNHYQPEAYHDGDIIYCGYLFADTDAFLTWQIVHIFFGVFAANEMFREQRITQTSYYATVIFGVISCVGFLHYCIEPIWFFAVGQQISILGEGVTGFLLIGWAYVEYQNTVSTSLSEQELRSMSRGSDAGRQDDMDVEEVPLLQTSDDSHDSEGGVTSNGLLGNKNVRRRSKELLRN